MGISKIQITDMPGPSWWEFMLQWGGIFIQAAAAAGTLWAVVVALRVASQGDKNRLAEYDERGTIVSGVVLPEVASLLNVLVAAIADLHGLRKLLWRLEKAKDSQTEAVQLAAELEEHLAYMRRLIPRMQLSASHSVLDHLHFMPNGKGRRVAAALGRVENVRLDFEAVLQVPKGHSAIQGVMLRAAEESVGVVANHLLHVLPVEETSFLYRGLRRAFMAARGDFSYADLDAD